MRKLVLENRKIIYFWDWIEIGNAGIPAKALLMVIMSVTQCTVYVMLRDDVRNALIDMPHRLLSDVPMLGMCRKINIQVPSRCTYYLYHFVFVRAVYKA